MKEEQAQVIEIQSTDKKLLLRLIDWLAEQEAEPGSTVIRICNDRPNDFNKSL